MNKLDTIKKNKPINFMRMGIHAERKYFTSFPDLFGGIAFNGTIVVLTPEATASFLGVLMPSRKDFFIDPLTYAFERHPTYIQTDEGNVKKSIKKLAEYFGRPASDTVGERMLVPRDFQNRRVREQFCKNVITFQKDVLSEAVSENESYLDVSINDIQARLTPLFVIAPYFYLDITSYKQWIDYNIGFVNTVLELEGEIPVCCEIVISRKLLHQENILLNDIAEKYKQLKCDCFLIWINDFPESKVVEDEVVSLRRFISSITENGQPIINLYGGYLSALLSFDGLTGFCHGPGYGENRNIVPVGGGLPHPKFYFTPLHQRILADNVDFYLKKKRISVREFYSNICDCPVCRETLQNTIENFHGFNVRIKKKRVDSYPFSYASEKTKELNNSHYIQARYKEITRVKSTHKTELLDELKEAQNRYLDRFGSDWASHLSTWHDALSVEM